MATSNSTKPRKPYPEFPLFPHATGRWAKKIRGRLHYFGPWRDPEGCLQKYLDQRDDLHAGRTPRMSGDGLTVRDLVNRFLTAKQLQLESQEITSRTFGEYHATCKRLIETFGKNRLVDDLASDDFERLRADIAKVWGPVRLGNEVQRIRTVFKYGYEAGLIDKPMRYGPQFKKHAKSILRKHRSAGGERVFTTAEVRALLNAASVPLRAMLLIGINAGFSNSDSGQLPQSALDLTGGWCRFPRPKPASRAVARCGLRP